MKTKTRQTEMLHEARHSIRGASIHKTTRIGGSAADRKLNRLACQSLRLRAAWRDFRNALTRTMLTTLRGLDLSVRRNQTVSRTDRARRNTGPGARARVSRSIFVDSGFARKSKPCSRKPDAFGFSP